ncbi:hypothetical protein AA23498_0848 [Acetobacter nitrogenifigens DSM 23921 = NBRC 105050]|nr:hypothetical protein [Acetobacter nitrogenifigens]GBQ90314.1 hypothetical protein AA23498_0848 [Acetobacter nitrogenifigens DSM 23921 = NBRC 105050]
MATATRDNLPGRANNVADFLTRAHGDHSGLTSAVSEYMGKEGAEGIPVVRQRAKEAGLDGLLQHWRDRPLTEAAEIDLIRALIPDEKIAEFSRETGLSREATIRGLLAVIPRVVYRNAERERRTT